MTGVRRLSYAFIALILVLIGALHLATLLLAVLFSLFVLSWFHVSKSKWVAVALFAVVILLVVYGAVHFIKAAVVALPNIAETSIPSAVMP